MGAYDTMRFATSAIPDEALEWASLTGVESLHGRAPTPPTRLGLKRYHTQTAN